MLVFFYFVMIFLFVFNFLVSNFVLWWSSFVISTMVFVWVCKGLGSYVSFLNYFVVQELMNLFFLFFSGSFLQYLFLLSKSGVSPFHFWIFSVCLGLYGGGLVWFLVMQKIPFVPVLVLLFDFNYVFLLVLGVLVCHFQYLFVCSDFSMLLVSSTESFNWCVVSVFFDYYMMFFLVFLYFFLMVVMVNDLFSFDFSGVFGWELVFFLMNLPFLFVFILKFFVFSSLYYFGYCFLIFFFSMVFSYLCLFFWLGNVSLSFIYGYLGKGVFFWVCYLFGLLVVF